MPLTGSLLILELLCVLYFHQKIDMMPSFWFFFRQAWTVSATNITNTTQPQPPPQKQELESDFFGEVSSFTTLLNDIHFHIFFIFYYLLHILHILLYYILNLFPFWSIRCRMPGTEGWKNCHQKRNAIRIPSFRHGFLFLLTSLRIGLPLSKEKDCSSTSIQCNNDDEEDLIPDCDAW